MLGDYIHSKGLKFATYADIGSETCQGYVGLRGHFEEDAKTFADWKVDYLLLGRAFESIKRGGPGRWTAVTKM